MCTRDYRNDWTGNNVQGLINKEQVGWKVRNDTCLEMVCVRFFLEQLFLFLSSFPTKNYRMQKGQQKNIKKGAEGEETLKVKAVERE